MYWNNEFSYNRDEPNLIVLYKWTFRHFLLHDLGLYNHILDYPP